jgi:hypothetical protein
MFINCIINWSPNFIIFALLGYLTRDWRLLSQVIAFITIPASAVLLYACTMCEGICNL